MPLSGKTEATDRLEESILALLGEVVDAELGTDVVAGGQIYAVVATDGAVRVLLEPERFPNEVSQEALAETIRPLVEELPGVERVIVKPRPRSAALRSELPGVHRVVGIHSGKGGVGKSTITVNLALALAARGLRIGLLDADVYGPSAPTLLGLSGRLEATDDGSRVRPLEKYGIKVISLGFLLPSSQALIWRGSLVDEGLGQLFNDVDWGGLDLLLIDLPPGTSDVHLAVARQASLNGIVTVTAPGQVSVDDVRRGMEMFADLAVPCLGLVENMSSVVCQRCGTENQLFGIGGGADLAEQTGLPLLARLPFLPELAAASDSGHPSIIDAPDSVQTGLFHALAAQLAQSLELKEGIECMTHKRTDL